MERIRQAKRILAGALVSALMIPYGLAAAAYEDTYSHWAENTIEKWSVEYGVLNGYTDGTFKPDATITRGAFAGILCRFLGYIKEAPKNTFSDTANSSWEDEILKLNAAGVYLGTEDGKALVYREISRQQALTMVCREISR